MISFDVHPDAFDSICFIASRAQDLGLINERYDRMTCIMDLSACHANGCPLDLEKLENAQDFDFVHDVAGIARHMDRTTGQLTDCFVPRFAARQTNA